MLHRLAVIIVNYRSSAMTIDCIDSLRWQIDPQIDRIVVVDNASGTDDVEKISYAIAVRNIACFTRVIAADTNGGFSAGNNIGIQAVSAEYYLLTNSDTVFRAGAIRQLFAATERYPDAGLIGPRLEYETGKAQISCFRFPTPSSEFIRAAQTGLITRLLRRFDTPVLAQKGSWTGWISFASVLLKTNVLREIGLMDEQFFMYFEDVDYCLRADRQGFTTVYWPDSRVIHLHGRSSGVPELSQKAKCLPDYYYLSRSHLLRKHYGLLYFVLMNMGWTAGRFISLFQEVFLRKTKVIPAFEHRNIWKSKTVG